MSLLAHVVLGFAPGLFLLWYFRHRDDLEPEPKRLVLAVFALGAASTALVLAVRPLVEDLIPLEPLWYRHVVDAFYVTAPLEEGAKLAAFVVGIYWHRELDEPLDGIVYGVAAGLGFASVENVLYLILTQDPMVVVFRAPTATLAHLGCTGAAGWFWAMARFVKGWRGVSLALAGVVVAIFFHGAYDYFLFRRDGFSVLALVGVLPLLTVALGLKMRWSRARSHHYHGVEAVDGESS